MALGFHDSGDASGCGQAEIVRALIKTFKLSADRCTLSAHPRAIRCLVQTYYRHGGHDLPTPPVLS
eukprot:1573776-Rhodomonas_salina.1